ncbi:UNVERIFIED_CONTAM: hypothetical protein FKN15_025613 [Acipenser sinensis]
MSPPALQVVLKPSGGRWSGSHRPVRFLEKQDCEAVCREVCSLLPLLEEGETVLLEAFCPTMSPVSPVLTQTWDMYRREVFLCLSPSWLSRSPSPLHPGLSSLFLHRGISFELGGRTSLEDFRPPRRVTYLLPVGREEGQEVTREADCPMGSSPRLAELLGDTLLTRVLLERNRVRCPPTLGLMYRPPRSYQTEGTTITAVSLTEREGQGELVQREGLKFLESS